MTRETKLALILGLAVFLIVGVFVGEYASKKRQPVPNVNVGVLEDPSFNPTGPGADERMAMTNQGGASPLPPVGPVGTVGTGQGGTPAGGAGANGNGAQEPRVFTMGGSKGNAAGPFGEPKPLTPDLDTRPMDGAGSTGPMTAGLTPAKNNEAGGAAPRLINGLPVSAGREAGHVVKRGDTLGKIASTYYSDSTLAGKLESYNKSRLGKNGMLSEGVTLRIPPKDVLLGKAALDPTAAGVTPPIKPKTEASGPNTGAPSDGLPSEKANAESAMRTYTVKSGDTLTSIASRELGSANRWKEILDLNKSKLASAESLKVGTDLKLPGKAKPVTRPQ